MSNSWGSYPKIFNLGNAAVKDLLNYPCYIQEKVDGSQFSFGLIDVEGVPTLRIRSKGAEMLLDAPEKMFNHAARTVKEIGHLLTPGWTYRGEYLAKPYHNALAYDRIPAKHIILFNVGTGDQEWLRPDEMAYEAARLGLEAVPTLAVSEPGLNQMTLDGLRSILDNTKSVLGGQLIEGVVIKPFGPLMGIDGKTLMGKFVSERFKEVHRQAWAESNPTSGDILDRITATYKVEARWHKAIQHLRDDGKLQNDPRDIPALLQEVEKDLGVEEKAEIQKMLWKWAWPHVARGVKRGFPLFYKEQLLKRQFELDAVPGEKQADSLS